MGVRIDTQIIEHYLTIGTNFSPNTSYALAVGGNTLHNGIVYFANGTTYYINNSAVAYLNDLRSDQTRLVDNWLGFYSANNAGGSRYGYIQTTQDLMNFVKENGTSGTTPEFRFNGNVQPSATNSYNLGASDKRWKNLYLQGNLVMQDMSTPSSYPATANKITWTGGSDGASIYYKVDAADTGRLFLNMSDDANALIALSYNDTAKAYFNPSTPSFYPVTTNTGSLGISSNYWGVVYTQTLAVSGNATIGGTLTVAGTSTFNGTMYWNVGAHWKAGTNITCDGVTANNQEWSFDLTSGDYTGTYWHVYSGKNSASILACYNDDRHVTMPGNIASTSTSTGTLQVTGGIGATGQVTALRLAANGSSTSFNLYVNGPSHLNGNVSVTGNITPTGTRAYLLGSSSYYWKGAYIWADGQIHPATYSCETPGSYLYEFNGLSRGFGATLVRDNGNRGSKIWNMAGQNILVEYTTNSGSAWTEKTTDIESRRGLTTTGNSGIGNIGNTTTSNAGGDATNGYVTHPQRVAGTGVRVTLINQVSNGGAYYGWFSCIVLNMAGYWGTYQYQIEFANLDSNGNEVWRTIVPLTTIVTNGSYDNWRQIYLDKSYYWRGSNLTSWKGNNSYITKLRVSLICTGVKNPDTTQSANRYSGWINRILCVGSTGSDVTSNTTYPKSSRYTWTMGRFNEPYYICDSRLGRVQFSTDLVRIYDDLEYTAANVDKWATLQLGNGDQKTGLNRHTQGRLLIYSDLNGYHYIQSSTGNTGGYTAYIGKGTGWIAIGGNGSSTGTGDTNTPIFLNTSGVLAAVTNIKTAVGGTGVTSHTANRLVWSTSATTIQATNHHFANASKIAINSTAEPSYNLLVNGTGRFNSILTLYRESATSSNAPAGILFTVKDTTTTKQYDSYIYVYQDHAATTYGNNMVINPAGGLFLGGGESAAAMYGAKGAAYTGEDTFITADGTTYIYSNANTVTNRIGFAVSTAGHILPQKVEAANDNVQNIGAESNAFKQTFTYRLNLDRYKGINRGYISYYRSSYLTWINYMSDATAGSAPTGGTPGTLGNVTTWAIRSLVENSTNYGWLWEAAANSAATANTVKPTARMALSSNTGYLRIAPNASSSTCQTSGLIIDSAANASSGNVAIELWRGNNVSWQIANESGTLYIRNNYTTAVQTTYSQNGLTLDYNTGAGSIPYLAVGRLARNTSYRLYVEGSTLHNGTVYFANGTTYYINNNADSYLRDLKVRTLGIAQTDGATGYGISLYGGPATTSPPTYGLLFGKTSTFGTFGDVSSDWATYFTMSRNDTRGWIFKSNAATASTANNYASISGRGHFTGSLTPSSWIDGQRYMTAAYNIADYSNNSSYNPWMRATNTNTNGSNGGKWFSFGTLGNEFYWMGSATTQTANSYDKAMSYNINDGNLTINTLTKTNANRSMDAQLITSATGTANSGNGNNTRGTQGEVYLALGNSTARPAAGTAGGANNARGRLRLFGTQTTYTDLYCQDQSSSRNVWLPNSNQYADPILMATYDLSGAQDLNQIYNAGIYCIEGGAVTNYPAGSTAYANLLVIPYRKPYGNTTPDHAFQIYSHTSYNRMWFRGSNASTYQAWQEVAHIAANTAVGTATKGVYVTASGVVTAMTYELKATVNATVNAGTASGTASRIAYYSAATTISSGSIVTDGSYLRNVGGYNNTSYALSTASFICNSWVRTKGATGWYNEDYGGGWYMSDNTWIRNYGSKQTYLNALIRIDANVQYGSSGNYYTTSSGVAWLSGTHIRSTSSPWPALEFDTIAGAADATYITTSQNDWGLMYCQVPAKRKSDSAYYSTMFFFREYSKTANTTTRTSHYEDYYLPAATDGLTSNKSYNILTTKDLSFSITGNAATATKATKDGDGNTIVGFYVKKSGDSMSGNLTISTTSNPYCRVTNTTTSCYTQIYTNNNGNHGIYSGGYYNSTNGFTSDGKWIIYRTTDNKCKSGLPIWGAVWNDYAECRECSTNEPGRVVYENGDDTLSPTIKRLSHFAGIISDTCGFAQGETKTAKTPIAVAGRVLAYTYQDRNKYKPGDCVCAAPNGTVDIMTREEIMMYPDRIVGTVSCIPTYTEWNCGEEDDPEVIQVKNRIWIKVR